jgi:Fe2+ transport system protein FeoA
MALPDVLHDPEPLRDPLRASALPLSELAPGSRAVIERVDASLSSGRRLCDLGFVPETEIEVVRRAPLGDPIAYEVRGTRLCLRRSEARHVWVRVIGTKGA